MWFLYACPFFSTFPESPASDAVCDSINQRQCDAFPTPSREARLPIWRRRTLKPKSLLKARMERQSGDEGNKGRIHTQYTHKRLGVCGEGM